MAVLGRAGPVTRDRTTRAWAALGALLLLLALGMAVGSAAAESADPEVAIGFEPVASGFDAPVLLVGSGDGSGDRFVVEQGGRIWRIDAVGKVDPRPMLDISERVLVHNERGLLGLAFHPDFARNGRFFVTYSQADDGATSISEFTLPRPAASDPAVAAASCTPAAASCAPAASCTPAAASCGPAADPAPAAEASAQPMDAPRPVEATERPLLLIPQIYTTHKGGMLAFDPDGMLVVSTGDGGSGNDPHGHGLDRWSLLGKLLRLDVDRGWPYVIPADNGFAGDPDGRSEIHAIGLRNPWRFSIDRASGDLYVGDVGQSAWEEIDVLLRGTRRASFGWSDMEGPACLGERPCDPAAHIAPAIAYPHVQGDQATARSSAATPTAAAVAPCPRGRISMATTAAARSGRSRSPTC